jgi:hypothetical protein
MAQRERELIDEYGVPGILRSGVGRSVKVRDRDATRRSAGPSGTP